MPRRCGLCPQQQQESHSQTVSSLTAELRGLRLELRTREKERRETERAWRSRGEDWKTEEAKLRDNLDRRDRLIQVGRAEFTPPSYTAKPADSFFPPLTANPVGRGGARPSVDGAAAEPLEQTSASLLHHTHTHTHACLSPQKSTGLPQIPEFIF